MFFIRSHITFESNVFRTSVPHYSSDIITLSRVNCYEIKIILGVQLCMRYSFKGDITNEIYGHRTVEELRAEIEKIHPPE